MRTGTIDQALELLKETGPEYQGFLANHGPMAAEALVALERPDAVLPWVQRYRRLLDGPPERVTPISPATWEESLGDLFGFRLATDLPRCRSTEGGQR
ncbi:MAG: hypothetical protein HY650_15120 [Acidobacteria bacterium]|nr:hypothetical protein [Acidobacteriota bacterium]